MTDKFENWLRLYTEAVKAKFGGRVWFIGLQGSYGRDEATEESDIDVVLILESVTLADLDAYSKLLDTLPERDKICGFVSGRAEIEAWDKSDLFQFCNDTTAIFGSLDALLQTIGTDDVKRAVKTSVCNIYHICAHNYVHEKSLRLLKNLYKTAAFTLHAVAYLQSGVFVRKQDDLIEHLQPIDRRIMEIRLTLKKQEEISPDEFPELSETLLNWASFRITKQ